MDIPLFADGGDVEIAAEHGRANTPVAEQAALRHIEGFQNSLVEDIAERTPGTGGG